MQAVRVDEGLWASSMAPAGVLERWRARDRRAVTAGHAVAEVRIEGALHEILAPSSGRLVQSVGAGVVIQPGDQLGWIDDRDQAG